ncbi:ribonuclease [bacterium 210820-DFI.6.37]|nr:ribonuclease [bacterium 210820-DFI.6.37]
MMRKILSVLTVLILSISVFTGCQDFSQSPDPSGDSQARQTLETVTEDGWYDSKEEVAAYLIQYGKLPDNYITKKEARRLGWQGGSLEEFAPGKSIGGDSFGNREKRLPQEDSYWECDIDTAGKDSRGAKRIVYSDDGDIYYTEDHYESFTLLAEGEEK